MILYDVRCLRCRFAGELGVGSMHDELPTCPQCGEAALSKVPTRVGIGGRASTGPDRADMPRSWAATAGGDPELVRRWHDAAVRRDRLEAAHPDLAGDRRPVLAHEGVFARNPLRAGDPLPPAKRADTPAERD